MRKRVKIDNWQLCFRGINTNGNKCSSCFKLSIYYVGVLIRVCFCILFVYLYGDVGHSVGGEKNTLNLKSFTESSTSSRTQFTGLILQIPINCWVMMIYFWAWAPVSPSLWSIIFGPTSRLPTEHSGWMLCEAWGVRFEAVDLRTW